MTEASKCEEPPNQPMPLIGQSEWRRLAGGGNVVAEVVGEFWQMQNWAKELKRIQRPVLSGQWNFSGSSWIEPRLVCGKLSNSDLRQAGATRPSTLEKPVESHTQVPWCAGGRAFRFFKAWDLSLKSVGFCCEMSMSALAMMSPGGRQCKESNACDVTYILYCHVLWPPHLTVLVGGGLRVRRAGAWGQWTRRLSLLNTAPWLQVWAEPGHKHTHITFNERHRNWTSVNLQDVTGKCVNVCFTSGAFEGKF